MSSKTPSNAPLQPIKSRCDANSPVGEKLQKVLARAGLGSRRKLEAVIKDGRVRINDATASLGARVLPQDQIFIDGRRVWLKDEKTRRRRVIAYYKPEGEICALNDPQGRTSVYDRLPKLSNDRWVMVGRLDINSSGLLLFTNDGKLAHRLMHPSYEIVREYAVRVLGQLDENMRRALTAGVLLDDGMASFDSITDGGGTGVNQWYHVSLKEGRKREVRRMFETQGLRVSRLLRTRYGSVRLPSTLKTGRFIELEQKQVAELGNLVGMRPALRSGATQTAAKKGARIAKKTNAFAIEHRHLSKSKNNRSVKS